MTIRMKGPVIIASGMILLAAPGASQQAAAPIARYTMDLSTTSGLAAMGGGMGAGMSMMFGGGRDKVVHQMELRLGSSQAATGAPAADHFLPATAKMGKSVPLVTPVSGPATRERRDDDPPENFRKPKGRLLIFWGCGAHAPKGQPVVIDFAKVAAGQMPPNLFGGGVAVPREWAVTAANSRTFGEWPNARDRKALSGSSSIAGEHRIAGNYSPEIHFSLAQDFLGPLNPTTSGTTALQLNWNSVAAATGYYAWVMGFQPDQSGEPRDMVWWASSASRSFGGALWDWLSPATVQRLIGQKVVMPPSQTSCLIPQEVKDASPGMMIGYMYAYGPEANFAYPPRPADPRAVWKPDWTARVRYRSNAMWFVNGPAGMGGSGYGGNDTQQQEPPKKKCRGGFGGLLGAVAGEGC